MRKAIVAIFLIVSFAAHAQNDDAYVVLSHIRLEGNKVTKPSVIFRELLFKEGDTIPQHRFDEMMRQSRENLSNTSVFNFVDFEFSDDEDVSNGKILTIKMVERWYVWPIPYLHYADRYIMSWFDGGNIARLSYGVNLEWKNVWGLLHKLDMTLIFGYNQKYALTYNVPYLTDKQRLGIEASVGYLRDKEVGYATINDKVRYYKADSGCSHEAFYAYLKPYLRFGFRNRLYFLAQYDNRTFSDTLVSLNPTFACDGSSRFQYFTLSAIFKNDYRNDHNYPLDGHYLELEMTKIGVGVFENEPNSFYAKVTADWYSPIKNRFYWASNVTAKLSSNNELPYFLTKGLGYGNDYIRTYDLYVVDALNYVIFKNNLKFEIIKPVTKNIKFIKNERFGKIHLALYANVFFDFGCSWKVKVPETTTSRLANEWIYGTGIGLDFVTYYDLVFRFEYGLNGLGETGFFLHLVAPI